MPSMSPARPERISELMKCFSRALTLAAAIAFSSSPGADNAPSTPDDLTIDPRTENAEDWTQTHLSPESDLREQIETAKAFLDENAVAMMSEISRLKTAGLLDRRSTSKIRNALDHARHSMAEVAESVDSNEQINGWSARMISFELGMAADTLAKQADPIEAASDAVAKVEGEQQDGTSSVGEQQKNLAKTLNESSRLLKETAQAIVRHLR
jgi:hypothetical protein